MSKRFQNRASKPRKTAPSTTDTSASEIVGVRQELVKLDSLELSAGTQMRVQLDEDAVREYSEAMTLDPDSKHIRGIQNELWTPLTVYTDGTHRWLADGFHRTAAAKALGFEEFQAKLIPGELKDAILHAVGANAAHGIRRSNEDKYLAVRTAFVELGMLDHSDRAVSKAVGVSPTFVGKVRKSLETEGAIDVATERVGDDGQIHDIQTRVVDERPRVQLVELTRDVLVGSTSEYRGSVVTHERLDARSQTGQGFDALVAQISRASDVEKLINIFRDSLNQGGALVLTTKQGTLLPLGEMAKLADAFGADPALVTLTKERRSVCVWPGKAGSKALTSRGLDAHPDLDTLLKRLNVATTLALTVDSTE